MKPMYLKTLSARIAFHEKDGDRREKRVEIARLKTKLRQAFARANDPRLATITRASATSEAKRILSKLERIDPMFATYVTKSVKNT